MLTDVMALQLDFDTGPLYRKMSTHYIVLLHIVRAGQCRLESQASSPQLLISLNVIRSPIYEIMLLITSEPFLPSGVHKLQVTKFYLKV